MNINHQVPPRRGVAISNNDVLLGRGRGASKHVGNKQFLAVVDEYKYEYNATASYRTKDTIGKQVFREIKARGGRFLELDGTTGRPMRNVVEQGVWRIANEKAALEKCKQALREKRDSTESSSGSGSTTTRTVGERHVASLGGNGGQMASHATNGGRSSVASFSIAQSPNALASAAPFQVGLRHTTGSDHSNGLYLSNAGQRDLRPNASAMTALRSLDPSSVSAVRPSLFGNVGSSAMSSLHLSGYQDERLALLRLLVSQQQEAVSRYIQRQSILGSSDYAPAVEQRKRPLDHRLPAPEPVNAQGQTLHGNARLKSATLLSEMAVSSNPVTEEDAVEALTALAFAGRATFTEEQAELERATMTVSERAAALSDLFGKYCNVDSRQNKRARNDLDMASIQFLIQQMKAELELLPAAAKMALTKAQAKCDPREFCNGRLERFLRCTDMDPKLAAQRFAYYWGCRLEVFGADKYAMRLTLSEALRDDLEAIEEGVLRLLPHADASGRQLLLFQPSLRTRGKYSSESLLRAFWYVIEVASQQNDDASSAFVSLAWAKDISVWSYLHDHVAYDRLVHYEKTCLPIRHASSHVCCPPSIVLKVVKPVLHALLDRHDRARSVWHTEPEAEVASIMAGYGITREMLPPVMGGTCHLNQLEWTEERRSIEMEEIS